MVEEEEEVVEEKKEEEGEEKADDKAEEEKAAKKDDKPRTEISSEIQIYVHTLIVTTLIRNKMLDQVGLPTISAVAGHHVFLLL